MEILLREVDENGRLHFETWTAFSGSADI